MILGFMRNFPWKGDDGEKELTNFREKILAGVGRIAVDFYGQSQSRSFEYVSVDNEASYEPKIHTFREDPHNRWKAGMKVQMVYRGAGYKIIDHFNKDIPELDKIKSIQKIKIKYHCSDSMECNPIITIDGKLYGDFAKFPNLDLKEAAQKGFKELRLLCGNDGFESVSQFKKWFKKDWEGKILHFTDFRYEL